MASIERVAYLHSIFCRCLEESKDLDRDAAAAIRQAANPPPGMDYVRQRYNDEADACERRSREVYGEGMDARRQIDREIELLVAGTPSTVSALLDLSRQLGKVSPQYESLPVKKALQIGPASPEDVIALAGALSSHGRSAEFATWLSKRSLPDADAALRAANGLERLGLPVPALEVLDWGWQQWHDRRLSAQSRVLLRAQGQAAKAVLSLESELAALPNDTALEAELLNVYVSTKDWPKLTRRLAEKRRQAPQDRGLWNEQKALLRRLGLRSELIQLLEEQTAIDPDPALETTLLQEYELAKDWPKLTRRLAGKRRQAPQDRELWNEQKALLRRLGLTTELIQVLEEQTAFDPDPALETTLLQEYELAKDWPKLTGRLAQIRRRAPGDRQLWDEQKARLRRLDLRIELVQLVREQTAIEPDDGDLEEELWTAMARANDLSGLRRRLAEKSPVQATHARRRKLKGLLRDLRATDDLIDLLEKELEAGIWDAERELDHLLEWEGRWEQLARMLAARLKLRPGDADLRGRYQKTRDKITAGPALADLLSEEVVAAPRDVDLRQRLLQVLRQEGRTPQVIATLSDGLREAPDRLDWQRELVALLVAQGHGQEAVSFIAECVHRDPTGRLSLADFAEQVLSAGGSPDLVRLLIRQKTALLGEVQGLLERVADILLGKGAIEAALSCYDDAIITFPERGELVQARREFLANALLDSSSKFVEIAARALAVEDPDLAARILEDQVRSRKLTQGSVALHVLASLMPDRAATLTARLLDSDRPEIRAWMADELSRTRGELAVPSLAAGWEKESDPLVRRIFQGHLRLLDKRPRSLTETLQGERRWGYALAIIPRRSAIQTDQDFAGLNLRILERIFTGSFDDLMSVVDELGRRGSQALPTFRVLQARQSDRYTRDYIRGVCTSIVRRKLKTARQNARSQASWRKHEQEAARIRAEERASRRARERWLAWAWLWESPFSLIALLIVILLGISIAFRLGFLAP